MLLKNLDWKKTLGIVAAVGLLFASFYKVDLRELWGTLARVNPWLLLAAFASSVLMNWAKGMRWRALTRDVKKLSRTRAFAIFHVCQMINLSLPALTGQDAGDTGLRNPRPSREFYLRNAAIRHRAANPSEMRLCASVRRWSSSATGLSYQPSPITILGILMTPRSALSPNIDAPRALFRGSTHEG